MSELKCKKEYAISQIKLFNYTHILDNLLKKYLENSASISYKQISNLYSKINKLIVHTTNIKNNIIVKELVG